MSGLCEGRVVIVIGAGRGIRGAHALAYAAEGASVVVNDVGAAPDGTRAETGPAQQVVDEIDAAAGRPSRTPTMSPTGPAPSGWSTPRSRTSADWTSS